MKQASRSTIFYGWIIVAASLVIQTVVYGLMYSFGAFFKPISGDFGWSRATTSVVASIGAVEVGLLGIVAGILSDKYGPRIVVSLSSLLLGASHLISATIHSLWQFYIYYGLLRGIGMSGAYTPILSTIPRWFDKKRGLALGMVVAGIGLGTLVLVPVVAYLISASSWRTTFLIIGALILLIVFPASLLLRRHPREMGLVPYGAEAENKADPGANKEATATEEPAFTSRQALRTRGLWTLFALFALYSFALGMVMVHIIPYAEGLGVSKTKAATFLSVIGGVSVIGRIVMGGAADKIGIKRAMAISFALMAAPMLFLATTRDIALLYVLTIIFGFGYGGMVPQFPAATGQLFGMKALGTIFGVVTLGATVGNGLGPLLAGYIYDATQSYQLAFYLGVIALVLGILLAFSLRRPKSPIAESSSSPWIEGVS